MGSISNFSYADALDVEPIESMDEAPRQKRDYEFIDERMNSPRAILGFYRDNPQGGGLVKDLSAEVQGRIEMLIEQGYEADKAGHDQICKHYDDILSLARQDIAPKKEGGIHNIKYPLLFETSVTFAASTLPLVLPPDSPAVVDLPPGLDQQLVDAADRVQSYINHTCSKKITDWEEQLDKILHALPVFGCMFRRIFQNGNRIQSEIYYPNEVIVDVGYRGAIEKAPRLSFNFELYPYEINSMIAKGTYAAFSIINGDEEEKQGPIEFLGQYLWLDMDGDGIDEPYVAVYYKEGKKLVSLVPDYTETDIYDDCIKRMESFVKYSFFKHFEGKFYELGMGTGLMSISNAISTGINELLDSAHYANIQGGFIGGGRLGGGQIKQKNGYWNYINDVNGDLKNNLMPYPSKEPSQTLFAMVQLLMQQSAGIAGLAKLGLDTLPDNAGEMVGLGLMEEKQRPYTGVFGRITKALSKEMQIIYRLIKEYPDQQEYTKFNSREVPLVQDFTTFSPEVIIAKASPESISNVKKAKEIMILQGMLQDPGIVPAEARKRIFQAADMKNYESLIVQPQQPTPEDQIVQKAGIDKLLLENEQLKAKIEKLQADSLRSQAMVIKTEADANKTEAETKQIASGENTGENNANN